MQSDRLTSFQKKAKNEVDKFLAACDENGIFRIGGKNEEFLYFESSKNDLSIWIYEDELEFRAKGKQWLYEKEEFENEAELLADFLAALKESVGA